MPSQNDTSIELQLAAPQYTPDDLSIIYEIVARAAAPGNQPFRAIWRAYDTVLTAHHIDPTRDSLYFRFILQMQGAPGEHLQEKLTFILDKLGIVQSDTAFNKYKEDVIIGQITSPENEFQQKNEYATRLPVTDHDHEEDTTLSKPDIRGTSHVISSIGGTEYMKQQSDAIKAMLNKTNNYLIPEKINQQPKVNQYETEAIGSGVPEDAADHLYELRLRSMLRGYLRHWHITAVRSVVCRKHLENQAVIFDRLILLRQAFDTWQEKQWFAVVERRVKTRYNQKLVIRAWSKWIHQTAETVQRAHELRQRIIAKKYFVAWRDLIIANEEKVHEFQLTKVLTCWRNRVQRRVEMQTMALKFYQSNLVHRAYWVWFFKLCGILAPKRHQEILIQRILCSWVNKFEKVSQLRQLANLFDRRRVSHVTLSHWVRRISKITWAWDKARTCSEHNLKQRIFYGWKRMALMVPLGRAMQDYSIDRVLHEHFTTWRIRARNQSLAVRVFEKNLYRKIIRNWRLGLRQHIISEYQESMLRYAILQYWARQERLQVMVRVNNRKLVRKVIRLFIEKMLRRNEKLRMCYERVVSIRQQYLTRAVFSCWYNKKNQQNIVDAFAGRRHEQAIARRAFGEWQNRSTRYKTQEQWATDALYYFTAKTTMERFKRAFQDAHLRRLRHAYMIIARRHKERLAIEVVLKWRNRRCNLSDSIQIAHKFRGRKNGELVIACVEHWWARTQAVRIISDGADDFNHRRLLGLAFKNLVEKHQYIENLVQLSDMRQQHLDLLLLSTYLRRLHTRHWDLNMLQEKGDRLFDRNQGLRVRFVFRLWREQLRQYRDRQEGGFHELEGFSQTRVPQMRQSAIARSMIIPIRTPLVSLRTPNWKTTGRKKGIFGNAPNLLSGPQTPIGSPPDSPLKRFTGFRKSNLGKVIDLEDDDGSGTLIGSYTKYS